MRETFWARPSAWVSGLLLLSLGLLSASMLTLREDLRFRSRALRPDEQRIVSAAFATWLSSGIEVSLAHSLDKVSIRAMDEASFERPQERGTYGYTDKWRRVLLNPDLCFAVDRILGPSPGTGLDEADLVPTLSTLFHEAQHLVNRATEEQAYEREWRFVRALQRRSRSARLSRELARWEGEMPGRIAEQLGSPMVARIASRLDAPSPGEPLASSKSRSENVLSHL